MMFLVKRIARLPIWKKILGHILQLFLLQKLPSINESNIHQKANEFIKNITKEINTIYDK